jgi:uncharacterized protein
MEIDSPKTRELKRLLQAMGSALISFSGGVDSAFLLQVASETLHEKAIAATLVSPQFPRGDLIRAERLAKALGVRHIKLAFDILSDEDFLRNDAMRCHFCKTKMIKLLKGEAKRQGLATVVDGSNLDDTKDYRPGLEAAQRGGGRSPLIETGFTKDDIRKESKQRGLDNWNAPSSACLASRIAYGTPITAEYLSRVDSAEQVLRELGFNQARVRYHPPIARIEVSASEIDRLARAPIREKVTKALTELGFSYLTLDLAGFRTGSMNDLLS